MMLSMTTTTETDRLSDLIDKKHEVLAQLFDLGRRQVEFIDAGDMSQLFKVLSAKQRLLAALQTVERGLDAFRHQDPEQRLWRTTGDRQQCAQKTRQCEALLLEIMQHERDSEQKLLVRRDETAQQLQGLHHAAESRSAYAGAAEPVNVHLDLSTES